MAFATHVPGSTEVITYDGGLAPTTPSTGTIGWSAPVDGYDWYCFDVTTGTAVSISVTRTSGDIFPNVGIMRGLADTGGTATLSIINETSNSTATSTTLTFTPDFTGPVTLWVSTFLGEAQGGYSVTMTGGAARTSCGANAGPAGPQISIAVPDLLEDRSVGNDQTITVPVTVQTVSNFANDVFVNVAGLPEGVTATLSPTSFVAPGRGTSTLTIKTGALTLPGTYPVFLTAVGGDQTASTSFVVNITCDPPKLLGIGQPLDRVVNRNNVAQLEVTPVGTGPFSYQWYSGYTGSTLFPLSGGNGRTFTTGPITDTTSYWVRVSNACGSVDSRTVNVTVGNAIPTAVTPHRRTH
ncbi:MAG TPA: hypothetical protein VGR02_21940 [Thermoanaerobaculia bacterium]|jgi:hypothetical protein|nr:hypothetical protein [Thermoanaerobaculia bacterium]